jgi:hypothetical protein
LGAVLKNHIDGIWVLTSSVAVGEEILGPSDWGRGVSEEVIVSKIVTENEGSNGGKLDENVDGWTGSILEWISDGISDNSSDVLFSEVHLFLHPVGGEFVESLSVETGVWAVFFIKSVFELSSSELMGEEDVVLSLHVIEGLSSIDGSLSESGSVLLDFFLGVIPSTTGVRLGDSDLDTGNDGTGEDTSGGVWSEDESSAEWGSNNEDTWGNHLVEGSFGGDGNATSIVWLVVSNTSGLLGLSEMVVSLDEFHHLVGGISDGSHGEGSEEVWEHSTDEESSELGWLEDINGSITDSGNESTEKSKSDEAGRSDSETFTDSGGGVSSGIKGISHVSDFRWKSAHFSASSGIVGDWAISVNGKSDWEGSEHTKSGETNTVHTGVGETESNGGGDANNWDDDGKVSEGESENNVWSWSFVASFSEMEGWSISVVGVVFSDETDDHTGPESEHDASVSNPSVHGEWDFLGSSFEGEGLWENEDSWDNATGHEDGRDTNLEFKDCLDVLDLDLFGVSEEDREPGGDGTGGGNGNWEEEGRWSRNEFVGSGGHNEGGAGGLSKRTEKIGSHTGNISDVITDVIGNGTWVGNIIFFKILEGLTDEIGTDISSFSVDTSTDSTEESDGRSSKSVTGNEFEHSSGENADSLFVGVVGSVEVIHAGKLILIGPDP